MNIFLHTGKSCESAETSGLPLRGPFSALLIKLAIKRTGVFSILSFGAPTENSSLLTFDPFACKKSSVSESHTYEKKLVLDLKCALTMGVIKLQIYSSIRTTSDLLCVSLLY